MNGRQRNYTKVSIVVPAHNEEGNIEPLMEEFAKVIGLMNGGVEVILVNDGSTDRTELKMNDASRRFRWVRLVRNRVRMGLTTALAKGFAQARGDILVFYPADLQFHPRDIPKMIEAIDNGADMVCGKKQGRYGKWLISGIYNLMTRILFPKLKVRDMNSVKAFTREVYNDFPTLREGWHRYLAAFAATKDYVVREVPVTLQKRHSGKSKFAGKSRILKGFTDLIAVKFQVSVFGDPMHLFGKLALWFFFIGLLIGGGAVYLRVVHEQQFISPRPLLYAVILFELAALMTFIMGIITEALVYIRDTVTEVRAQNIKLLEEIGRRSGSRPSAARDDDSEGRYYERSDDRVYERRGPERPETPRPEPRTDSRPEPRRQEPREPRREEGREERRDDRREERRPARTGDRRHARDDRRPPRRDQGPRRDRDRRPMPADASASPAPVDTFEPTVSAPIPELPATPIIPSTPATPVEHQFTPPSQTPELRFDDENSNVSDSAPRYAQRSGRRVRRVRPVSQAPGSGDRPSGSDEPSRPPQENSGNPDRPLTIKVRELPPSPDQSSEDN